MTIVARMCWPVTTCDRKKDSMKFYNAVDDLNHEVHILKPTREWYINDWVKRAIKNIRMWWRGSIKYSTDNCQIIGIYTQW